MHKKWVTIFLIVVAPQIVQALRIEEFSGIAKINEKVAYTEKHRVEYFDDGKIQNAETRYESPEGKLIALLKSDFSQSVTVPDHVVEDFRSGNVQGLRRENGKIVLFDKEKNKSERTRVLVDKDAEKRILVGCQGLNYYLLSRLDGTDTIQSLPLRFLIPGELDYFDFDMKEIPQSNKNLAEFEISVKSWFLRIFAPKLLVKYDRKTKRLIWYQGLSNIKNDKGENQSVTIEYLYKQKEVANGN